MPEPSPVSVVVLAYGAEEHLGDCVNSLLASDPAPEIVVVDNGAAEAVAQLPDDGSVTVLRPGRNLGFAGGCDYAAARATGEVIVFVNSDVVVSADAVRELADAVADPGVGLASGLVLLAEHPDRVNSAGNPIQFLCFSWSGGMGDLATDHSDRGPVAGVSGAAFSVRRDVWNELGGFEPLFFAYCEDMDLSLRAWQRGYSVEFVPSAVCWHWHEFGRHRRKLYLLERNRLITLLTVYDRRTMRLILPIAALIEIGVMLAAIRDGWARQKWDGWTWIWRNRDWVAERRRRLQAARTRPDAALVPLLRATIDPPVGFGMSVPRVVNRVLESKWTWIARRVARGSPGQSPHGH